MTLLSATNTIFSLGIILSQVGIVLAIIYLLFFKKKQFSLVEFVERRGLILAFLVSLISVAGSLFYSNVIGFPPCELCWFQRIFMYPLVVVLGMALVKKDRHMADYGLALAGLGFLVSLYHNYIYYYNGGLNVFCLRGGVQVSCIKRYVFEFGYVTIPMMALTAFALVIIFLVFYKFRRERYE